MVAFIECHSTVCNQRTQSETEDKAATSRSTPKMKRCLQCNRVEADDALVYCRVDERRWSASRFSWWRDVDRQTWFRITSCTPLLAEVLLRFETGKIPFQIQQRLSLAAYDAA